MNILDKFLKKLKTDRNTFFTYLFTLMAFYVVIDRFVEILLIGFTGISVDYWGPIKYTIAMAIPVAAFYLSGGSKFVTDDKIKLQFFYIYTISLYIMLASMVIQWVNKLSWTLLFMVPNYKYVITSFDYLIHPALSSFAWYVPIISFYPLFKWLYTFVDDTKDLRDSIYDYGGININQKSEFVGPFSCEIYLCRDKEFGTTIKIPESRRFESMLVVGVSGSGKTSMVFEPMIARDIERKHFFKESAKEMGYTALKAGVAVLNSPYSNEYINENFSLNMLSPGNNKDKVFQSFFKKLMYSYNGNKSTFKDLGITYMAPDIESIEHIKDVCTNFGFKYKLIDPNDSTNSVGLNPFIFTDPVKTSIAISSVLKRLYDTDINLTRNVTVDQAYMQNISSQAVENLVLVLKELYPREHSGDLPTLEDLLELINNFDNVEKMVAQLQEHEDLTEKYKYQINYFKKNFFKDGSGRAETEKCLQPTIAQLENLLRYHGVKNILCNRHENLNYDKALANGEIILLCTRRGDLGASIHKAFGLFFLLLMQYSVLTRPGTEKTRIPHFLYIDEFPPYVCRATEDIFTLYRKYRVGTIISAQNLSQFGVNNDYNFRQTILANCSTKIVFGNNTPEDNEWWQKEFGDKREWKFTNDYKTDKGEYDTTYKSISWAWKENFKMGKINSLKFKACIYKTRDVNGKMLVGQAKLDFLEGKYKQKQKIRTFNFAKFAGGIEKKEENEAKKLSSKFNYSNIDFDNLPEDEMHSINPIQTRTHDMVYDADDQDAIIDMRKNKNDSNIKHNKKQ